MKKLQGNVGEREEKQSNWGEKEYALLKIKMSLYLDCRKRDRQTQAFVVLLKKGKTDRHKHL